MRVKICPLCDSEMKKSHYCDTCKSFIWHPEIVDVHYNAEARGLGEIDCAYGDGHDRHDHQSGRQSGRQSGEEGTSKARTVRRKTKTARNVSSHEEVFGSGSARRREAGKPGQKKSIIAKIVTIVISLNLVGAAISAVGEIGFDAIDDLEDWIGSFSENVSGDDLPIDEEMDVEEEAAAGDDSGYRELTDEDLAAYPDGCNGYQHFELTADELLPDLESWMNEYFSGNTIESDTDVSNYEYTYGDDDEFYVYLQAVYAYNIQNENKSYISASADSVTNQLHSITAANMTAEDMESFLTMLADKLADDYTEADLEQLFETLFEDDMNEYDYSRGEMSNLSVFVMEDRNGTLWMDVSPWN